MRRLSAAGAAAALVVSLTLPTGTAGATSTGTGGRPATYTNPVTLPFTDTFADPSIIRGQDGAWYAYGTEDALHPGGPVSPVPIGRSTDLAHWTYAGAAFAQPPSYAGPQVTYWAPDIRYLDGRYVMYYTATDTNVSPRWGDFAIGAATAPTPTGPWTHTDQPVVPPVTDAAGNYLTVIDPAELTTPDGTKYLYYGSYSLGVYAVQLSADGLHTAGQPRQIAIANRYEGSYVVRHGDWYYLFASSANCCAGPASGYAVFAARSRDPLGPFLDREGVPVNTPRVGGTQVISPQGNQWVGTGHNSLITDDTGQDYLVYHAIDRNNPYLNEPYGVNRRPMLIDRLDWIDGWPTVRAGVGASAGAQPAPVTTGPVHETFRGPLSDRWLRLGAWSVTGSGDTGYATGTGLLLNTAPVPRDLRVRADVRTGTARSAGLVLGYQAGDRSTVLLDRDRRALVVETVAGGRHRTGSAPLPAGFAYQDWHQLTAEVRGTELTATVTEGGLADPVATVQVRLSTSAHGRIGVLATGGTADADNVVAAPLYRPVTRAAAPPRPTGGPLPGWSADFTGNKLGAGWTWVRPDPAATVSGGTLNWPVEAADLTDGTNTAGVLLRQPPPGDYLAETRLTLDLGTDTVRNFQQAGLIVYAADDNFARLDQVASFTSRQTEFARMFPYAGQRAFGGTLLGVQADTTWLRIARTTGAAGEQVFRAASSRDGIHWNWGGAWTFAPGTQLRIGFVSQGGATPATTAHFNYLRFYRLNHG